MQNIFMIVLEAKIPINLVVFSDKFYKRSLKTIFPDIYHSKTNMKYYYLYQQCKNRFVIARVKKLNCITFATFFL